MIITVYSKPACPGCDQIKNYLKAASAQYTEVLAGRDLSIDAMKQEVLERTGITLTSVPFVMVDDNALGGVDKFMPWFREHKDQLAELTATEDLDLGELDL